MRRQKYEFRGPKRKERPRKDWVLLFGKPTSRLRCRCDAGGRRPLSGLQLYWSYIKGCFFIFTPRTAATFVPYFVSTVVERWGRFPVYALGIYFGLTVRNKGARA